MADSYVENRLKGLKPRESAWAAGYSPNTKIAEIERPGGPVHEKMMTALEKAGINEEFLADEYKKGIYGSKTDTEGDWMAHSKYLLQLGYLMGHHVKNQTAVAVQVNTGKIEDFDASRAGELIREVAGLVEILKEEISSRQSSGVHAGDSGASNAEARP